MFHILIQLNTTQFLEYFDSLVQGFLWASILNHFKLEAGNKIGSISDQIITAIHGQDLIN